MAGEALRSLTAEVNFDIDYNPLRRLDRILDELRERLTNGGLDQFIRDLQGADRHSDRLQGELDEMRRRMDRLGSSTRNAGNIFSRFGHTANRTLQSLSSRIGSLGGMALRAPFSLPGLLIGGGAAFGIGALATKSIGGAAELEMQGLQLEALIGDATKAKKLFDSMNVKGMKSVFSERDFLEGAKSFLPLTKDLKKIDELTALQERLAASNPTEGMQGSAFAIREAMAGDTVSLAERFNIPKSMLTNLRKATSMNGKVEELDKILTQMGFTQAYLNKVNESASAQWDNTKSNLDMMLKRSGARALEELKPFLKEVNKFLGSDRAARMFERWGQGLGRAAREAANFGRWLMEEGGKAFDYIDRKYLSNPEFQKLPFNKKIDEVFSDIKGKFDAWYQNDGKKAIEDGAQKFVDFTIAVISNNLAAITAVGIDVGKAVGSGVLSGFKQFAKDNPEMAALSAFLLTPGPMQVKLAAAVATAGTGSVMQQIETFKKDIPLKDKLAESTGFGKKIEDAQNKPGWKVMLGIPGNAKGLPFVPHNDYLTRLHEGERVLTSQENRDYTKDRHNGAGGSWGMPPVNITVNVPGGSGADVKRQAYSGAQAAFDEYFGMLMRTNPQVTEG